MLRLRERLRKLERSPLLQRISDPVDPALSLLEQIEKRALEQLSYEDFKVLLNMTSDLEKGVRTTISERESAVAELLDAASESEARRAGFQSIAEAERKGGQKR